MVLLIADQDIHVEQQRFGGASMAEMTRLTGKVAVVTGASQGLGEHLAFELAANGAAVALAARNRERLEAIQSTIEARGGRAVAVPTDLSSESDCKALIERVN